MSRHKENKVVGVALLAGSDGTDIGRAVAADAVVSGDRLELKATASEQVTSETIGLKEAIIEAVSNLFGESGIAINRGTELRLSVPDKTAKVSILNLPELPEDTGELDALIRWKGAKTLYMEPAECSVGYELLGRDAATGEHAVLVVAAEKTFTAPIEDAFSELGLEVPYINIHSFNILNLLARELPDSDDFIFIMKNEDHFVMVAVRGGAVDFYRFKELDTSDNAEFISEVSHSLGYYASKGKGLRSASKLYLFDASGGMDEEAKDELEKLTEGGILEVIGVKTFMDALSVNLPSSNSNDALGVMGAVGALLD